MITQDDFRYMCDELHSLSIDMFNEKTVSGLNSKFNTAVLQLSNIFLTLVDRLTGEKVKSYRDVMLTIAPNFNDGEVCVDSVFNVKTSMPDCERLGCTDCWNRPYKVGDNT